MKRALFLICWLASVAHAAVDLTLYNSVALLDSNGSTPLEGTATAGDLVQLILVGPNGVIDPPDVYGNPSGDDALLFTSHVNAGLPTTNTGFLVQSSIVYADSLAGTNAFVRFWNSNTTANASYYGTSTVFALPAGDSFGLAEFDFVPSASYPHIANIPFSSLSAVPEPSSLFLVGSLLLIGRWLYRRRLFLILILVTVRSVSAQIAPPLDVTASTTILDAAGNALTGNNPVTGDPTPRCLVQILNVGPNGVADWPNPDGSPGGDDTVYQTTVIGQGINPLLTGSGRFSTSFYPPPAGKVYARTFDAATVGDAAHYGQSATFTVQNVDVFDLSAAGLLATKHAKGSTPTGDDDGDGQSNLAELTANTDPGNAADRLDIRSVNAVGEVGIDARAGRTYTLERSTDDLTGPMTWTPLQAAGPLGANQNLVLSDPNPPATPKAFYRVRVTLP